MDKLDRCKESALQKPRKGIPAEQKKPKPLWPSWKKQFARLEGFRKTRI